MQNESQKNCNLSVSRTQANLGATRPEAADKIAVYRVKVFLFELF